MSPLPIVNGAVLMGLLKYAYGGHIPTDVPVSVGGGATPEKTSRQTLNSDESSKKTD